MSERLRSSDRPLSENYDVALLDLDGVVYIGPDAVAGVPDALASVRAAGMRLAFVTNNASRTPSAVAAHLVELGIDAEPEEVITSSQAAARYLADRLGADAVVLVVGTEALAGALHEQGLRPVLAGTGQIVADDVAAVVQGYSPETDWRMLADAAEAIGRGAVWVATNVDPTVPSPRGPLPGNGSMVHALRHATGAVPVVTGKPEPTMHRETVIRTGAKHPIVVGDRLDTDIEGANAVGCASLLVLSGVTSPRELLLAAPQLRPDFLATDASGLLEPHPSIAVRDGVSRCGAWEARRTDSGWQLDSRDTNGAAPSTLDALRALCALSWATTDAQPDGDRGSGDRRCCHDADCASSEVSAEVSAEVTAATGDDAAARALDELGLSG